MPVHVIFILQSKGRLTGRTRHDDTTLPQH